MLLFPSTGDYPKVEAAPANRSSPLSVLSVPAVPQSGYLRLETVAGEGYCGHYKPLSFTSLDPSSSTCSTSAGIVCPLY